MNKSKRFLSFLLALCMVISMIPTTVLAAETVGPFTDVKSDAWYSEEVQYVYDNELMNGTSATKFDPDVNITRGMLVTVLHRMEGTPAAPSAGFVDVPANQWYANAINWAANNGIVNGYGGGKFGPEDHLTREQKAAIMYRYAAYKGFNVSDRAPLDGYTDAAKVSGWALDAVKWAVAVGLIQGVSSTELGPVALSNRAQLATVIMRFRENIVPEKHTVRFELNYEGASEHQSVVVYDRTAATAPEAPVRPGYDFTGWYTDASCVSLYNFSSLVTENMILYAGWEVQTVEAPRDEYYVTFMLNDTTQDVHVTETLGYNELVQKPEDPEREGFVFNGWFLDEHGVQEFDFNTPITYDLVLFAGWSSPNGDSDTLYHDSEGGGTEYNIVDIKVENGQVLTTMNANTTSVLVVEILDESTMEVLQTYSVQTPEYCEMTDVPVVLDGALPQYFVVRATLYNAASMALCEPLTSIEYTSAYAAFKEQTVDSFEADGERVLSFSETDNTNNFGVLADDVVQISADETTNVVTPIQTIDTTAADVEEQWYETYHIANPDESILNAEVGDILLIESPTGTYLFKVGSMEQDSEGSVTITPDSDVDINDFYKSLKLDMTILVEDEDSAAPTADIIDVSVCPSVALGGEIEWTPKPNVKVSGSLSGTGTVEIEMNYDFALFGEDYFECSVISTLDLSLNVGIVLTLDNDDTAESVIDDFELPDVHVPTAIPGLSAYFKVTIPVKWEISGGGNFNFHSYTKSGFTYDTVNGRQNVDEKSRTIQFGLEGKAELKMGPKVELGLAYLTNVVKANVGVWAGVKVEATAYLGTEFTDGPSKHACALCIDGTIKWFVEVTATLKFCIIEDVLDATPINATLFSLEGWINILGTRPGEFYLSLINSSDSVFKGRPHFGGGSCPNEKYRIEFKAEDAEGNALNGVQVALTKQNGQHVDSDSTSFHKYMYNGIYNASATIEGNRVFKSFVVSGAPATITLNAESANGKLNGKILSSEGGPIAGASIVVAQGDLSFSTCTSDSAGSYTANLPAGTYSVRISKSGYIPFETYVTVEDGNTTYLETAMLIYGSDQHMGGFSGTIRDAVNNNGIDDVTLKVRKGWNNKGYTAPVTTMHTNSSGYYEYSTWEVFGVMFGLPAGYYTVSAEADGYVSTSFNVIVKPGQSVSGCNASMSPEMTEEVGEYRIVLRWGEVPRDLDSHFNGTTDSGYRDHIYYSRKWGDTGNLDLDDTSSFGPETVTVTNFDGLENGFTYSVHDFTNRHSSTSTELSESGATIQLYSGATLLRTYHVPTGRVGNVWNVFSINANGRITDLNTFAYQSDASEVGASFANYAEVLNDTAETLEKDYEQD